MAYHYEDLIGKIISKFGSRRAFAYAMHISPESLSMKLNGKRFFDQREISAACELLGIGPEDVTRYFFALKVQ